MTHAEFLKVACPICRAQPGEVCRDIETRRPLPPERHPLVGSGETPSHYARMLWSVENKEKEP